jgi:Peptidase family M1 domain
LPGLVVGTVLVAMTLLGTALVPTGASGGGGGDFRSGAPGVGDDYDNLLFALETQTRPVYSKFFFTSPPNGDSVIVHEVARQWFGDSVALAEWKHIWLNEGFAQYAEWMWAEEEGLGAAQEQFDALYNGIPATDPFWNVVIGDPGPELMFDIAVYFRGAMAVHALRQQVGDRDFFRILRVWTTRRAGGHGVRAVGGGRPGAGPGSGAPAPLRARGPGPGQGRGRHWPGRSPLAASRAVSATLLARVSGRLAWTICWRAIRRADGGKPSHRSRAPGRAASAAARSSGTTRSSTASSLVQDPSRLASSIRASPASAIRPSARSRSIRSLFDRAQPLPRLRGENHCMVRSSSTLAVLLSIHPKHSASWTASS